MLGNLVKHEFRATSRIIPLFYLAVVAMAVPAAIFNALDYDVMSVIFSMLLILTASLLIAGTVIYLAIRFYKGMFGAEGYLTMTLPADEGQILLSRWVVAAAWAFLGGVCFATAFYYSFHAIMHHSHASADEISMVTGMFSGGFTWFMAISAFIGNLTFLAQLYMCVAIAHVRPFRKLGLGAAVIAYMVIYFIQQIITLPLTLLVPLSITYAPGMGWSISKTAMIHMLGSSTTYMHFDAANVNSMPDVAIGIASLLVPVIVLIVCPLVTSHLVRKKINIR